jgi:ribokinase
VTLRRPTIREVAARAGVSIGTVSHVLTGRKAVRPATRAAIDAAIGELGYVPDLAARALIARRGRAPLAHDPAIPRLTTVGYLCADHTALVAVLPHRDDRMKAAAIEKRLGGCAANVAVTAAGLGPPLPVAVELLSLVGDDADSDWALGVLANRKVGLHPLSRRRGGRLSRCFILVEAQGSRTIVNEPLQVPEEDLRRWLGATPRPPGRHGLHLQGDQVPDLTEVLAEVRAHGLLATMQTTGLPATWRTVDGLRRLRQLFDLIVLDRDVARAIVGPSFGGSTAELLRRTEELGRAPGAILALTLGPEGAALFAPGEAPLHVAAPVIEPIDTTGAGDTFAGTLLAAWLNGRDHRYSLTLAVEAGSRSIAVLGAQEHGLTAAALGIVAALPGSRAITI